MLLVTGPGSMGTELLAKLESLGITGKVLHRGAGASPAWWAVRADITDPASLAGACDGCSTVLHLAALTHSNSDRLYERVNAAGTANLLRAAERAGVERFLHVSTRAIAPSGGGYSRSKAHAEELVRDSNLAWTILRPAEVYGAGREGLSPFIERIRQGRWVPIVADGGARLAPVFVADVVEALCAAVVSAPTRAVIHLVGPEEMTQLEMTQRIAAHFGSRSRPIHVSPWLLHGAARALSWLPLRRPPLYVDQVSRLLSPKPYETESARALGITPRRLEEGLTAMTMRPR